jgi:hypothetical protein
VRKQLSLVALFLGVAAMVVGLPVRADDGPGPSTTPVGDSPTVANPIVHGPITNGIRGGAYNRSRFPLVNGYVEEEFFYEGTASDGAGNTAPYKTRILVRRPSDPKTFNGSVVLDWTNVTVPDDTDVSWLPMHDTIMERGFVYVAVAAQRLAIEASPIALKQYDPVRYGSLSHPGDEFSFDIYSQAAEAVLDPIVLDDLRPLVTRRLGVGASQSGGRLKTYINDWAEEAGVFEGFMPQLAAPSGVRRDLVPILWLNSQSEVSATTVEADSGLFRLWEMSGSAHAPHGYSQYQNSGYVFHETNGVVNIYDADEGGAWGYQKQPGDCVVPNIYNPLSLYSSALVALDDWVRTAHAPGSMPRADRSGGTLHFDDMGNLVGGLRLPLNDVPIAKYYAGTAPPGSDACGQAGVAPLVGSSRILSVEELRTRYGSSAAYAEQFEAALDDAVAGGRVLPEGARDLRHRLQDAAKWVAIALGEVEPVSPVPTPIAPPGGVL